MLHYILKGTIYYQLMTHYYRPSIEKLIYKSLLDNMNNSSTKNAENEWHRLPESPKRRAHYQRDIAMQELQIIQKPEPMHQKRIFSGSLFSPPRPSQPYSSLHYNDNLIDLLIKIQ